MRSTRKRRETPRKTPSQLWLSCPIKRFCPRTVIPACHHCIHKRNLLMFFWSSTTLKSINFSRMELVLIYVLYILCNKTVETWSDILRRACSTINVKITAPPGPIQTIRDRNLGLASKHNPKNYQTNHIGPTMIPYQSPKLIIVAVSSF